MYDIRKINIWKTEENRQDNRAWMKAEIEELNLATRSYNCLKRAGCKTIGDLMKILNSEGNGLKGIRNLGLKSEKEILTQLERFRAECAKNMTDSCGKNMTGACAKDITGAFETQTGEEQGEGSGRTFARRAEVRGKKDVWEADIETFHLFNYALTKLRDCRVRKVKDLYATNPKHEPGWYAVRELLEKI